MEALAVVGLVGNILQLVDFSTKLLDILKELYKSEKNATRSNQNLQVITLEMKRLSLSLARNRTTTPKSDDEERLFKLAQESELCADELLALLVQLQNRDPTSKLQTWRAALRNFRKQSEKIRLQTNLNNCRKQINIELGNLASTKTLQKLEDITSLTNAVNKDVSVINDSIQSLQTAFDNAKSSTEGVQQGTLDSLQTVLHASNQAVLKAQKMIYLNTLKDDSMTARFNRVEVAHAKTFEWLVEDPNNQKEEEKLEHVREKSSITSQLRDPSSSEDFKRKANAQFVDWLRFGHGIFHISGKPGAGKSTLMKFLCQSPKTMEHLDRWSDGKQLIFAKAFFWRFGSDSQKSLEGLLRSLLYQVLSESSELIPHASHLHLGDIRSSFESMMRTALASEERKLVFFIDGLDEFDGSHIDIVRLFFTWTERYSKNIKICVSSREWNQFMVGFSECPKLRIHECTKQDISQVVTDRLDVQCQYLTLVRKEDLGLLSEEIVRKAEGVFLWVRLVLNVMEEGFLNGDSLSDLERKIHAFPSELDELYQHLFDSIKDYDRRKAFVTMRIVHHVSHHNGLPLLQLWFLNDVMDDPEFATKMPVFDEPQNTAEIVKITKRQIYGRCKGFLEVCPSIDWDPRGIGEVRFMHNTVHEFLLKPHINKIIDDTTGHIDFFRQVCQTFLAAVKFWVEYYLTPVPQLDLPFILDLAPIMRFAVSSHNKRSQGFAHSRQQWFLDFLNHLETTISGRLGNPNNSGGGARVRFLYSQLTFSTTVSVDRLVRLLAHSFSVYEFFETGDPESILLICSEGDLENQAIGMMRILFGNTCFRGTTLPKGINYNRLYEMSSLYFSWGISPNSISHDYGLSFFECFIAFFLAPTVPQVYENDYRFYASKKQIYPYRLLRLCIHHGARSDLRILLDPESRSLTFTSSNNGRFKVFHSEEDGSPILAFAKQRDWVITLRDLFELWFPDRHGMLIALLEENNKSAELTATGEQSSGELAILDSDCRDWAEVELGRALFKRSIVVKE